MENLIWVFFIILPVISPFPEEKFERPEPLPKPNIGADISVNPPPCVAAKHLLIDLAEKIRDIHSYVPKTGDDAEMIKKPIAADFQDCKGLFEIANNLDSLRHNYRKLLISGKKLSDDDFYELQISFEEILKKLSVNFETLVDVEGVEKITREKNLLQQRIHSVLADSEATRFWRKKYEENLIALIANDIIQGQYSNALEKFRDLSDPQAATKIVQQLGALNDESIKVLYFIELLPTLHAKLLGFRALLDATNLDHWIFAVEYSFREYQDKVPEEFNDLPETIRRFSENMVDEIADKIATMPTSYYANIIRFSSKHKEAFNVHLEEIVEKTWKNKWGAKQIFESIMTFSDELEIIAQSGRVYYKLYKLMEEANDLSFNAVFEIASKTAQLLKMTNYKSTPDDVKLKMETIMNEVPEIVKSIVSGKVCFKNEKTGGYLHQNRSFDGIRNGVIVAENEPDLWEFKIHDKDIQIRHSETEEFLYSEGEEFIYNPSKRWTFTWRMKKKKPFNNHWKLIDVDWHKGKFYLQNVETGEFLNANPDTTSEQISEPVESAIETIMKSKGGLATGVQHFVENYLKIEPAQIFTWRGISRGLNPEWLIVDSKLCK